VTPATPTLNKTAEEPEIPSFREWTEKALEEEEKKRKEKEKEKKKNLNRVVVEGEAGSKENATHVNANVVTADSGIAWHQKVTKKNFASLDCGAKVAAANPEAQNGLHLISYSKDEYMLNKCTDKVWFVVELCESIKAYKVELANFELYSSVPKNIRISMGNAFPGRDKDWTIFGEFEAIEDRSVQSFISEGGVFGKYVKVEVLSHYGSEHYCIVSLFKMYGISDFELIVDDDDDDPVILPEDPPDPEPKLDITTMPEESLFFGVFPPNKQLKKSIEEMNQALNQTSLIGNTFMYNLSCPDECDDNRFRDIYFLLAFDYSGLLKDLNASVGLQSALTGQVCRSYGFQHMDQVPMPSYAGLRLVEFYATLFGVNRLLALCNVMEIKNGHSELADQNLVIPPASVDLTTADVPKDDLGNAAIDKDSKDAQINPGGSEIDTNTGSNPQTNATKEVSPASQGIQTDSSQISPTKVNPDDSKNPGVGVPAPIQSGSPSTSSKIDPTPASDQTGSNRNKQDQQQDKVAPKIDPPVRDKNDASTHQGDAAPPKVTTGSPTGSGSVESHPGTNNGQTSGHKTESVWQKLSNKIKALEKNVSLSGGYLEQLSVQYKKQIEDLQLAVRQSGEALTAASEARELDRAQIRDLKDQIGQLKIVMEEVSTRMETMGTWDVVVHSLFLVVEIFIGILFVFSCFNRREGARVDTGAGAGVDTTPAGATMQESSTQNHSVKSSKDIQLKRRHSHEDKGTNLGRSQIEELKNRRSSLDLNTKRNSPLLANQVEGLSKRQKKRMQRRLSRANAQQDSTSPVKGQSQNNIALGNMFELLNNSHDNHKKAFPNRALSNNRKSTAVNVNGHISTTESSRSATPDTYNAANTSTATSTPSHTSRLKVVAKSNGNKKRSKSTSPSRKIVSSVAKQKDMFKQIQQKADRVDWILHPKKS